METEKIEILEKVTKLFLKYGIKSVSMDDIARELGISKKTLYQYFKDKEEIIQLIVSEESEKKSCQFSKFFNKDLNAIEESLEVFKIANEYLKEINPVVEYDLRKYYPKIHKEISEFRTKQIDETIKKNLLKGISEGLYRNDFDLEIIAKIHIAGIDLMMSEEFFSTDEFSSKKVFNELFIYHLRGICSKKGLKFLEEKLDTLKKQ
jgi:AcrR family transcriptional regulator